ncbi:MAG TPA: 2,3-bisphosphoglycerate-independent phosphoglycerate mutase [Candidatus Limnocylindrales bacterium]
MTAHGERPRPIVLVVLDGFGIGRDPAADAIAAARMPVWRGLLERWPHAKLDASEEAVGLPRGQMGNSEVGHLNLGTGQPVLQDLPRIDRAIADGTFFERPVLLELCERARQPGRTLHLISLVGPGGVHANDRHLVAVVELAARQGVERVRVHALLDGRDTAPRSAIEFVPDLERRLAAAHRDARIATVGGRYYAMDRDKRWERTAAGYDAIVHGFAEYRAPSATVAVEAGYARGENDEFVKPTVIEGVDGVVRDGDAVLHCNFRADRARQLTHALADGGFDAFDRAAHGPVPQDLLVATMTEYEGGVPVQVVFPPDVVPSLAEAVSEAGWRQFHVAETEKYAHVTYFFNGGREEAWPGEDRLLVPSRKDVPTYDHCPEMSALGVTDALVGAIGSGQYDLVVANYANPDMVGHTGVWDATVAGLETVDACLGRVAEAVLAVGAGDDGATGGVLLITADHGNADELKDAAGKPVTAHSLNPVPILALGRAVEGRRLRDGVLADVTPTILELGGLPRFDGVAGRSLLEPAD